MNCTYCKNPIHDDATECEWCGNKVVGNNDDQLEAVTTQNLSNLDNEILGMLKKGLFLNAVKLKKDNSNLDLKSSRYYIYEMAKAHGIIEPKSGCFIATACYGDYDSEEVKEFRRFRDEVLINSKMGLICISSYYK